MITKKGFVAIIFTFIFFASLITIVRPTTSSQTINANTYWADINDNGMVDIYDAIILAGVFGASNDYINKTALLLECNVTYASLMSRMDSLNNSFIELKSAVESMNATSLMPLIDDLNSSLLQLQSNVTALGTTVTQLQASNASVWASLAELVSKVDNINATLSGRIATLEAQVATMNTMIVAMNATIIDLQNTDATLNASLTSARAEISGLNTTVYDLSAQFALLKTQINGTLTLAWDSGWYGPVATGVDTVINFGKTLDTAKSVVYMAGRTSTSGNTHQIDYGGIWTGNIDPWHGAYWWNLTPTSITVHRHGNDSNWVYVRIMIFKIVAL